MSKKSLRKEDPVPVRTKVTVFIFDIPDGRCGHWIKTEGEDLNPFEALHLAIRALLDRLRLRIW